MKKKCLFIDIDCTLVPKQSYNLKIDNISKLSLEPYVIPSLLEIKKAGFKLVMMTNLYGLGTSKLTQEYFDIYHNFIMKILISQGIKFENVLIFPRTINSKCNLSKQHIVILENFLKSNLLDKKNSYVIGYRKTDKMLAKKIGIKSLIYKSNGCSWKHINNQLTKHNRYATLNRITNETSVLIEVWLDKEHISNVNTGIKMFDHLLKQISVHGKLGVNIIVNGDLNIDDHHTIEDTALVLGKVLNLALGNKNGIGRFGFILPMDECVAQCILDISGRPYLKYQAKFNYNKVGDMSTEMIEHFFYTLSYSIGCNLYLTVEGKNDHHKVESLFKAFGRSLRQAINIEGTNLPSSKGTI